MSTALTWMCLVQLLGLCAYKLHVGFVNSSCLAAMLSLRILEVTTTHEEVQELQPIARALRLWTGSAYLGG